MSLRTVIARHGASALLVAAGLLLTGCLRSEMAVTVDGDGSGTVAVEVYFDEVELDQTGLTQDDLVKLVDTATQSIDGVDVSAVGTSGSRGFRVSIPFDDYNQLTQALTAGAYGGVSVRLFQSFQVAEGENGHWSMNAVVDPSGFRATLAQIPAGFGGQAMQVQSGTEFVFSVTLPGKVLRSNADSIDRGTARWELKGDTQAASFTMENEPAPLLTTVQMILVGAGALVVIGFFLVLTTAAGSRRRWSARRLGRRRRRRLRKGDGVDPSEQWQPKAPAPGTVGGRDESVLPVMPAADTAPVGAGLPPVAPPPLVGDSTSAPLPPVPTVPPAPVGAVAGPPPVPTVPPAPVGAVAGPPPVPTVPPAPVGAVAGPPPVPAVAPAHPPPVPQAAAPAHPQAGALQASAPQAAADAQPVAYTVVTVQPIAYDAATAQPTSAVAEPAPTPGAPPVPDQSHWLAPNPHQDSEAHWLDQPPPEDAPADPNGWVPLPPRSSDVPRFEYPEVDEI